MNSYSFGFNGSTWILILLVISAILFSIYSYYRTIPDITKSSKVIFISLRSLGLILLIFVLFDPVLSIVSGFIDKPKLVVLIDNSQSVGFSDSKGDRKKDEKQGIVNSNFSKLSKEQLKIGLFDDYIKYQENFTLDSLSFSGKATDISSALKWAKENDEKENICASLIITDGIFNTGINPIYSAEDFGKPVYVIGIGDTSEQKDISLQSLITNEFAYVDNSVPINISLKSTGYSEGSLNVKLFDNGIQIAEQTVRINSTSQISNLVFEYLPKQEGIRKLTASVSALKEELTQKNNSIADYINVLKNKRKICLIAGSPSPDVSFIRNSLESEKGIDVKVFIQKKGAEFYDNPPGKSDLKEAEMIVLVGFPISSSPQSIIENIKSELSDGKPLLFVSSQYLDFGKLKTLEDYLPFSVLSSKSNEFMALPDFKEQSLSNPLVKINGSDKDLQMWNQLPPLFHTETFVKTKPETEVLSYMKVNNVQLKEPLIMTRNFQNKKTVAVMGYGLYRWKLLGYASEISKGRAETQDLFDIFIMNTHKWLSVGQNKKNVMIKTSKKQYNISDKVEFIAQIYDAALTPVENAEIHVKITNGGNQNREIVLNSIGNGRYNAVVEGLPEGDYYYSGEAISNGNKLGSDNGRFNIGDVALEYRNLSMNYSLLKTLAERTGGKFYFVNDAKNFLNDLSNNKHFSERPITLKLEKAFWSYLLWLLGLSVLVFSLEWFLRKRAGML